MWYDKRIAGSLIRPSDQKQLVWPRKYAYSGSFFASKGYPSKSIFYVTTADGWDCVAAVERLPALHYSADFIFLSFGIVGIIVEL